MLHSALSVLACIVVALQHVDCSASGCDPDFGQLIQSQPLPVQWNGQDVIVGKHSLPPDMIKITRTVAIKVPYPQYISVPHNVPYPVPVAVPKPFAVEVPKIVHLREKIPVPFSVPPHDHTRAAGAYDFPSPAAYAANQEDWRSPAQPEQLDGYQTG